MNRQDKYILERNTRFKYQFLRLKTGIYEATHKKTYAIITVTYIVVALLIWGISKICVSMEMADIFQAFNRIVFHLLYPKNIVSVC